MRLRIKFFAVIVCIVGLYVVCFIDYFQPQADAPEVLWIDPKSPRAERRKSLLWQWQANASQICDPNLELLDIYDKHILVQRNKLFATGWHELQYTHAQLYAMQACAIAALNRWAQLANELKIQNWSLQAGSLVGQICYESMVPWDDDIDVLVFGHECDKLQRFFGDLAPASTQPDARFHSKKVDLEFEFFRILPVISSVLYYASYVSDVTRFETRFKLRSRLQPYRGDILGLDIECRSMPPTGLNDSMVYSVRFGPTTAQMMKLDDMSVLWPHKTIGC